jgi:hypothetical protein
MREAHPPAWPKTPARSAHVRGPWAAPAARAAANRTDPLARGRKSRGGTATAGARCRRVGWRSRDHRRALRVIPNRVRYYGDPRGGWGCSLPTKADGGAPVAAHR